MMRCDSCGRQHSGTATYCPHCGADVEKKGTSPEGGAPEPLEETGGEGGLGLVGGTAQGAGTSGGGTGGRRAWLRVMAVALSIIVIVGSAVLYFQRRDAARRQQQAVEWLQDEAERLREEDAERLSNPGGLSGDEQAAADAAREYASTQGLNGTALDLESASVAGSSIADVVLSDPSTGKQYHLTLTKGGTDWNVLSMEEAP